MGRKLLYVPEDFHLNPDLLTEGITQSEMQTLDNCPERWNNRYNLMIEKKGEFAWSTTYGGWIHSALEEWYSSGCRQYSLNFNFRHKPLSPNPEWRREKEYYEALAEVQMQVYTSFYKNDKKVLRLKDAKVEEIVRLEYEFDDRVFLLTGMIDMLVYHEGRRGFFTLDHKTSQRMDRSTVMGWDFRFQFMFYCWLAKKKWPKIKILGWIPNGIKKPQLRWNQDKEDLQEHMARVRTDMLEFPDKYFYRDVLPFTKNAIERFERVSLRPKLIRYKLLTDPKTPMEVKVALGRNQNSDYCVKYGAKYACPYLPLCQKGPEINGFMYQKREHKHEELQEDNAE